MPAHPRRDSWGKPLPDLVDARREGLFDRPHNQDQRRFLFALMEDHLRLLLRRGEHGSVTITVQILDGMLHEDIEVQTTRRWRGPRGD
jgi:hypothetical protein